jgi:nicotinamide-nucleotide amidase
MVSSRLTDMPGISAVFDRSIVTYSNRAKMEELGVSRETLDTYGAVSEQTASEMAEGVRRISGTDIGISVTGIAGLGGGSDEKPVGLVFTALAHRDGTAVRKLDLWGSRSRIRKRDMSPCFRYAQKVSVRNIMRR